MFNIIKPYCLLIIVLVMAACGQTEQISLPQNEQQPNIVVFLVDDMGLMDTSVPFITDRLGNAQPQPLNQWYRTPNMEALAKQGTRFSQFYAQSVCSPTRASLLTGQNAARHHTTTWIKPTENNHGKFGPRDWNWQGVTSETVTFPALLRRNGYTTIHIGKGHFGPLNSEGADPTNIGFDINIAGDVWGRPKSYYGRDHYGNHPKYKTTGKPLTHHIPHLEAYYKDDVYLTEAITQEANLQIAKSAAAEKPFLLYLSHYAVHAPFHSDPRFSEHYRHQGKSEKAQAYATLVEGMDKSLGDVIKQLEQSGVAENTLILFMGDNGGDAPLGGNDVIASSAPLKGKKGTSWEGGMRAPLIAAWAKVNSNNPTQQRLPIRNDAINTQMATVLDIFPTILEAAAVEKPSSHTTDGFSLAEQLAGEHNTERDNEFLMHFPHQHRHSYFTVYRQGNWKLIYQYNPDNKPDIKRYQLFNLSADPTESRDLAKHNPKTLAKMVADMLNGLQQQNAQFPVDTSGNAIHPVMPVFNAASGGH